LPAFRDPKLLTKDEHFKEVPVRIYLPRAPSASKRRAVIFIHGGCGMFGSIRSYEKVCRYIARESDSVVMSVGYRLAPEHKYPGQNLDCLGAAVHFLETAESYGVDSGRVIICGDSAGATFSTSVCQELVDRTDIPKIRAQVMIYPFLQALNFNLPSYQQNAFIPLLSRKRLIHFIIKYLNKDSALEDALLKGSHVPESINLKYGKWINPDLIPDEFKQGYKSPGSASCVAQAYKELKEVFETTFSPLLAEDSVICRLPDTCIITCEYDVLRDDGLLYKKRLEDNNVQVTWHHLAEGFH
ncbi:ADCL4 protein, partial [Crypturellus soui]|nr:ADCL4 protein [Crypturellus soui]